MLAALGLCRRAGISLVVVGEDSPVAVCRLLIAVVSLVAEQGLQGAGSQFVQRFNCPAAGGIFPDQESNPRFLHWQATSLCLNHIYSSPPLMVR